MPGRQHEMADAPVDGDARRGPEAGHASHNPVVARRHNVGTRAQNGNKLEHIEIVRGEYRRAWYLYRHYISGFTKATQAFVQRHRVFPVLVAMERLDPGACRGFAAVNAAQPGCAPCGFAIVS